MRRLEPGEVASGYDDVLDLRMRADVVERRQPILRAGHMILLDELGILADRVAAGAVLAIDGTDRSDEKQDLVRISVHDARHWRMPAFGKRVDLEAGMVLLLLAAHRQKLPANRIVLGLRPVDQAEHVGIEPDRHAALAQAGLD